DRLAEPEKRTVQTASVIGREFARSLLRRVSELHDRLEQSLGELKRIELIYEKAGFGDVEYVFRHALTQDVAYASLLQSERRRFKEAEALATRYDETERLDTIYAFLVQYYWAKGQQDQAIEYGKRCLATAEARGELGLRVTGHFYLAHAYLALGQFPPAIEHSREILLLLEGGKEGERFGLSGLPYSGACAT